MNLTFPAQFGAAGTPIGYRISEVRVPGSAILLYAIDALLPYREHLLDENIAPVAFNYVKGNVVTQDGAALFPVTLDVFYRLGLSPVRDNTVTNAMQSSSLDLSPETTVTGFDSQGRVAVFDGIRFWWLTPSTTSTISAETRISGANFIRQSFLRRAPLGGVRIEPHEQLMTSESGTTATFTAVLTAQPTATVALNLTSSDTTEGTVSPATATFTTDNWNTPQTITVTGVLDNDIADQAFTIVTTSTSADPNYHAREAHGGILAVSVTNTNVSQAPALAPGTPSVRQGSAAATATLGTASDLETAAGSLTVATVAVPTGLSVGTITNTNGAITAPLSATCSATLGPRILTLRVTDGSGATTDRDVTVNIQSNTAPALGAYPAASVALGGSTIIVPSAAPTDNGSMSLSAADSTFTGALSADASTGQITVTGAAPPGAHIVTVMASDNCSATATTTFTLTVTCPATSLGTPSATFTVGGGSGSVAVIAGSTCAWSGSSAVSWISLVNGSGAGNGIATYTVAGNGTGASRSTELTIGGQPFSVTQLFEFADAVITEGVTPVRALHLQELRFRIDQVRARHSLAGYSWTDSTVTGGVTPIRAVHVNELRAALLQAYSAAGRTPPAFTDGTIDNLTVVRAIHLIELRAAVAALESSQ